MNSPSSKDVVHNVYLQLRPRNHEFERCLRLLTEVLDNHPHASITLGGLSRDFHQSRLTFELKIANPAKPTHISTDTLAFANDLFTKLFDYLPCYVTEPTQQERDLALRFISTRSSSRVPSVDEAFRTEVGV